MVKASPPSSSIRTKGTLGSTQLGSDLPTPRMSVFGPGQALILSEGDVIEGSLKKKKSSSPPNVSTTHSHQSWPLEPLLQGVPMLGCRRHLLMCHPK